MAVSCKRLLLLAACIRGAYLAGNLLLSHYIADYDTSSSLLSESCEDTWPEVVAAAPQQRPWVVWDSVFSHRIAACGYEYEQFFAFFPGFSGQSCLTKAVQLTHLRHCHAEHRSAAAVRCSRCTVRLASQTSYTHSAFLSHIATSCSVRQQQHTLTYCNSFHSVLTPSK
jgi:hypothetical protein